MQRVEVDPSRARQRMAGARDHRDAVVEQRLLLQILRVGGAAQRAEDEVDVSAAQRRRQRVVRALLRRHVQLRMARQQRGDRERQDPGAAERERADVDAALQRALAGRDVRADVAQLGEHPLEVEGHDLAGGCRHQSARSALEQRDAEPGLQVAQRGADGRLRQVELARDRGHVALLGEAREDREAPPVQDRREQRDDVGRRGGCRPARRAGPEPRRTPARCAAHGPARAARTNSATCRASGGRTAAGRARLRAPRPNA